MIISKWFFSYFFRFEQFFPVDELIKNIQENYLKIIEKLLIVGKI